MQPTGPNGPDNIRTTTLYLCTGRLIRATTRHFPGKMKVMQKLKRLAVQKLDPNLRREIKADIRKQHYLYVDNLVGDVKANPMDFYR